MTDITGGMTPNGGTRIILSGCTSIIRSGPSLMPNGATMATLTNTDDGTDAIGGSETTVTGSKSTMQTGQIDDADRVVLLSSRRVFCGQQARQRVAPRSV